jgi:RNA polymerase sigma factor (sigma-70 family)
LSVAGGGVNFMQMQHLDDQELLEKYATAGDHTAFAVLVRRHIAFVYSAALRQVRDPSLADDVTQAVMIVLARRAASLRPQSVLQSWLFAVTRNAAQNAMKMQSRRRFHEQQSAKARAEQLDSAAVPSDDLRQLDAAIARLPELERSGVLLHYFADRSHEEVGATLGLSAEAARKRVARALEKMRQFLIGRGVTVEATALAAGLRAEAASASAPAGLVESAVNVAMLSSTASSASSMAIAQGVTRMLTFAKLKLAASIALVAVAVAGAAVPLARIAARAIPLTTTTLLTTSSEPATAPAAANYTGKISDDTRVEFLGVSPYPPDENSWFSISGQKIDLPAREVLEQELHETPLEHVLLMRVFRPKSTVVANFIDGAMIASNAHLDSGAEGSYLLVSRFKLQTPADTVSVRLGFATADWKPIARSDNPQQQTELDAGEYGQIVFMPPEPDGLMGGTKIEVHHQAIDIPNQLVVVDADGKEHTSHNVNVNRTNDDVVSSHSFGELAVERIKSVTLQVRGFDKFVEAKEISLSEEHPTTPQITVRDAK